MWHEGAFRDRLLAGQVIRPTDDKHAEWQAARAAFTPQKPARFTAQWAQNHDAGAPFRPETWLTNTFMHGGVGHLLGNMIFLFLFGFTLEMALGPWLYAACYLVGGIGAAALAASGSGSRSRSISSAPWCWYIT